MMQKFWTDKPISQVLNHHYDLEHSNSIFVRDTPAYDARPDTTVMVDRALWTKFPWWWCTIKLSSVAEESAALNDHILSIWARTATLALTVTKQCDLGLADN